jgi:hypothetical protein
MVLKDYLLAIGLLWVSIATATVDVIKNDAAVRTPEEKRASVGVPEKNLKILALDLSYEKEGNDPGERLYNEKELIQILQIFPNLLALNITGQPLTKEVGETIHDFMPKLLKLISTGNIHLRSFDDKEDSWERVDILTIGNDYLERLIQKESPLKSLVLDYSSIDDQGLEILANGATQLVEISLVGTEKITDRGLAILVKNAPDLRTIYLGDIILTKPHETKPKIISQKISKELIESLSSKGINVVITSRTLQKN